MEGFDFFCKSDITVRYGQAERDRISQELKREEAVFFSSILSKRPIQSAVGVGLDMLIEMHYKADMVFITAFLTGTKKTNKENHRCNEPIEHLLYGIGYHVIRVLGHYDNEKHSYCVINYAEDTGRFISDMESAAALWWKETVLICPRKGYGSKVRDEFPFFYYPQKNKRQYASGKFPSKAVDKYYTVIGRNHESYPIDFDAEKHETYTAYSGPGYIGLNPVRSGYKGVWIADNRRKLREAAAKY